MKAPFIDVILTTFVLAYVFSAWIFMMRQKQGDTFITSFDKAVVRGGCFFILGSGLSFVLMVYGNLPPLLI